MCREPQMMRCTTSERYYFKILPSISLILSYLASNFETTIQGYHNESSTINKRIIFSNS